MSRKKLVKAVAEARETGDDRELAESLLGLSMQTPLFAESLTDVVKWLEEAQVIVQRTVVHPSNEIELVLRRAEVFLASGMNPEAIQVAVDAGRMASKDEMHALTYRSWITQARALVRLGRQDEAIALFESLAEDNSEPERDEPMLPGMAFLAVGEAHLFEERYEGAYRPLTYAIAELPMDSADDRLRYDAQVGVAMLDFRRGDFHDAAIRFEAALTLAESHKSRPEQVECLLQLACVKRAFGSVTDVQELVAKALERSKDLEPPSSPMTFPTEHFRNLAGAKNVDDLIDAATEDARACGGRGDLMGYIQLTILVATLLNAGDRNEECLALIDVVAESFEELGQEAGVELLKHYREIYSK